MFAGDVKEMRRTKLGNLPPTPSAHPTAPSTAARAGISAPKAAIRTFFTSPEPAGLGMGAPMPLSTNGLGPTTPREAETRQDARRGHRRHSGARARRSGTASPILGSSSSSATLYELYCKQVQRSERFSLISEFNMENFTPVSALAGGLLIGASAALFLVFNGRIAGISGILGGLFPPARGEIGWRAGFPCRPVHRPAGLRRFRWYAAACRP